MVGLIQSRSHLKWIGSKPFAMSGACDWFISTSSLLGLNNKWDFFYRRLVAFGTVVLVGSERHKPYVMLFVYHTKQIVFSTESNVMFFYNVLEIFTLYFFNHNHHGMSICRVRVTGQHKRSFAFIHKCFLNTLRRWKLNDHTMHTWVITTLYSITFCWQSVAKAPLSFFSLA